MGRKIKLSQKSLFKSYYLALTDRELVYQKAEAFGRKRKVAYRQILAVLSDSEQAYIVLADAVLEFKNDTGTARYEYFMAELLRRLEPMVH